MAKRTALITGASSGIGFSLAHLFAQDGHDVVLVARNASKLEELAATLRETFGVDAYVVPADLSVPHAAKKVVEAVTSEGLTIDFLVNNAGFGTNGAFHALAPDREVDQIQVNVTALVELTALVVPGMVERGFGRILNIASTAGFQPGPYMSTYYATKAFVVHFTEGIAEELSGTGVTATAHCPGATATGFAAVSGNDKSLLFKRGIVASADAVAKHAYVSMHNGRVVAIHGALNWLTAWSVRFSPRAVIRKVTALINRTS